MSELSEFDDRISPIRTGDKVRAISAEDILTVDREIISNFEILPLQEIIVEGFLSFREKTTIKFGNLNILVGPNGSGKSNLIDCIRILRNMPFDIQETFKRSGFESWLYNSGSGRKTTAFFQVTTKIADSQSTIHHQFRLEISRSLAKLEEFIFGDIFEQKISETYFVGSDESGGMLKAVVSKARRRERFLQKNEYNSFQSILSQIRDASQYPEVTGLSNLYSNFKIYSEWFFGRNSNLRESASAGRSDTTLSETMDNLPLALNSLERTIAHEKIKELLEELKETYRDFLTRTLFGRVGLELIEVPLDSPLPAARLSDGTLRFLALATILLNPNPSPLICIEEPELGMHPDMIRMVAKMIIEASTKAQIIVTTHSEHLLSALQDDFDVLFAFDANSDGSSVRTFTGEEYKIWQEDHTLGELWTSGEIGGNRW